MPSQSPFNAQHVLPGQAAPHGAVPFAADLHLQRLSIERDGGYGACHIGQEGCVRLAEASVWLLARIAGWDGN